MVSPATYSVRSREARRTNPDTGAIRRPTSPTPCRPPVRWISIPSHSNTPVTGRTLANPSPWNFASSSGWQMSGRCFGTIEAAASSKWSRWVWVITTAFTPPISAGAGRGSGTRGFGRGFGEFGTGGFAPTSPSMGSTRTVTPEKRTASVACRTRRISIGGLPPRGPRLPVLVSDHLGLEKVQQILGPAGLAVGARHVEPAERVGPHERAGGLSVEIEIAAHELPPGLRQLLRVQGVDRPRQPVRGAVGDPDRVVEIAGGDRRDDRAENLFLRDPGIRPDVHNDRRRDVVAPRPRPAAAGREASLALPDLDVLEHLLLGAGVDDRPRRKVLGRRTDHETADPLGEHLDDLAVHLA